MQKHTYSINLAKNIDFYDLQTHFPIIFHNFHLVYYLSDIWGVTVISKKFLNPSKNPAILFQFMLPSISFPQQQSFRFGAFELGRSHDQIEYHFCQCKNLEDTPINQMKPNIKVNFSKKRNENRIDIQVYDQDDWFNTQYARLLKIKFQEISLLQRVSPPKINTQNQVEYFYKESFQERFFEIQEQHFSLALQGGGVKGVAYIGVADALTQINQAEEEQQDMVAKKRNSGLRNIRNIIGSSAGGILGLAICCEMNKASLMEIASTLGSVPYNDKVQLGDEQQEKGDLYLDALLDILSEFRILDIELINTIRNQLGREEVKEKIIEELQKTSYAPLANLFKNSVTEDFSLANLLAGNLMKGDQIGNIAAKCLQNVFVDRSLDQLKSLSFRQFYQYWQKTNNPKEFSCTSVDLHDHIIRFFNHKTTPDMPVCKAVQMTGSFPVAFKSQQWKQDWGKYYIHYHSTRRQIDLTGHQFTDGGLLSNFPIKYLDNENMRPMYFSHKKNYKTKLYGFALFELASKKQSMGDDSLKNIGEVFQKRKCAIICSNICSIFDCLRIKKKSINLSEQEGQGQNLLKRMQEIPVLKFGLSLLETFLKFDVNFQKQCFKEECFNTPMSFQTKEKDKRKWFDEFDHGKHNKKLGLFIQEIKGIFIDNITDRIASLRQIKIKLQQRESNLQQKLLVKTAEYLSNFLKKVVELNTGNQPGFNRIKQICKNLEKISGPTFFYRQRIWEDFIQLKAIIQELQVMLNRPQFDKSLNSIVQIQNKRKIEFQVNLNSLISHLQKQQRQQFFPITFSGCLQWISLQNYHLIVDYSGRDKVFQRSLEFPQLAITRYCWNRRKQIRSYVYKMLNRTLADETLHAYQDQNERPIHLVLESKHISEVYFYQYIKFVEQAISEFNYLNKLTQNPQRMFKISAITASGYQSLAAFLYASQLSPNKTNYYIWKIMHSISYNTTNLSEAERKNIVKTKQAAIIDLQEQAWSSKYDFFGSIAKKLSHKGISSSRFEDFNQQFSRMTHRKQQINQIFERVINYSMENLYVLNETDNDEEQKLEKIKELFPNIENQKSGQQLSQQKLDKIRKQNKKVNEESFEFYTEILHNFQDLIRYTLLIHPDLNEATLNRINSKSENDINHEELWRKIILNKVLSNMKFISVINELLSELNLPRECSLKQFHESLGQSGVTINMFAIESQSSRLSVLNHYTRPSMPVWAAILATSALPSLHAPVTDEASWRFSTRKKENKKLFQFFGEKYKMKSDFLESGNNLSRIPLEFLTNNKIKELIGIPNRETYLSFTFDDLSPFKAANQTESSILKLPQKLMRRMSMKPIGRMNLVMLYLKYSKNISKFLKAQVISDRMNQLNIFINSNDKTFLNVYRKQTIQLPMILGTLDFKKVGQKVILNQCIDDAKFTTLQKLRNEKELQKLRNEKEQKSSQELNKILYFRIEEAEKKCQSKSLYMRFPSAIIEDFFDVTQRFRIFYKFSQIQPKQYYQMTLAEKYLKLNGYQEMNKDKIALNSAYQFMYLKIMFPNYNQQKQEYEVATVYHQINLAKLYKLSSRNLEGHLFYYKLFFDKFYPKNNNKLNYNPQEEIYTAITSFMSEEWPDSTLCVQCGQCQFKTIPAKENRKCRHCSDISKVIYKCSSPTCSAQYCILCKFFLKKKNGLRCPLNHPILAKSLKEDFDGDIMSEKTPLLVESCDFCQNACSKINNDEKCGVNLCDLCIGIRL